MPLPGGGGGPNASGAELRASVSSCITVYEYSKIVLHTYYLGAELYYLHIVVVTSIIVLHITSAQN